MKMSFNPISTKPAQKVMLFRKPNSIIHPNIYFNIQSLSKTTLGQWRCFI